MPQGRTPCGTPRCRFPCPCSAFVPAVKGSTAVPKPPAPIGCLTLGEARIVDKVGLGMTSPQIAAALLIARGTVDVQIAHAHQKLGVHSRTALIHQCYVKEQLPRPRLVEVLWLLAKGAGYSEIAQHCTYNCRTTV
ncbi:helix-turn-helix transcriptional regulator [Streptomyces xanthochromogenes]|uniref:helix-turn-helix transcriptional regulator n=1 Tax=Streptomyces xanthochromogenes TaxID=67384 RepID=UPI003437CC46